MWENQEHSEHGWTQSSPDQCRHGGKQLQREMGMEKVSGELEKEIPLEFLLMRFFLILGSD